MFTRFLSRFRRPGAPARSVTRPRSSALRVEALEAREVPAVVYGLIANNGLIRFDSATPGDVTTIGTITGLGANETVRGIDFRPRTGQLIASTVTTGSAANSFVFTYSINPLNAQATLIGQTAALAGAGDVPTGYDFNPTVDRIRVVNTNDENARLNPNNGALAGNDTDLTPAATTTIIAAAYDRNFDRQTLTNPTNNVIPTTLYVIDRNDSQLGIQGGIDGTPSPNGGVITDLAPLGFNLTQFLDGGFDIATVGGAQRGFAALADAADNMTRLYSINLVTAVQAGPVATSIGLIGNGSLQVFSIAIVPESVVVVGSGSGAAGDVRVLDSTTGAIRAAVVPFAGFAGGVRVAAGDVTGDGVPDAVVSAIAPQGHVKVFDGTTGAQLPGFIGSFFAFAGFQGTVNVTTGDLNADGRADVIVVANGANGHVKAFSGVDGSLMASFFAYANFPGNVSVAAADFNNDGIDEIVTVAAANGHVKVFNADGTAFTAVTGFVNSFFAFDGFPGDVSVAAGDVNGDGRADIVVGSGAGTRGHVKAFSGTDGAQIASFFAFGSGATNGAFVALADANADGLFDIRVTPDAGAQADVFTFDLLGQPLGTKFAAFAGFGGGATVAGARP